MEINGITIRTPYDPGLGVKIEPDWRRKVAIAWVEDGGRNQWLPSPEIYYDKFIHGYVQYLKTIRDNPRMRMPPELKIWQDAEAWYTDGDSGIKQVVEPMLMTELPYGILATDILPTVAFRKDNPEGNEQVCRVLQAYERLFFNIRDDDNLVNESIHARTLFALRGFELDARLPAAYSPRVVAAFFGYAPLMAIFHNIKYAHGDIKGDSQIRNHAILEVQATLMVRALKKELNSFDSVAFMSKNTEHEKMLYDTKAHEREHNIHRDTLERILEARRPKLVAHSISVDQQTILNKSNMDIYLAKKNVADHGQVTDRGVNGAVATWAKAVDTNFAGSR